MISSCSRHALLQIFSAAKRHGKQVHFCSATEFANRISRKCSMLFSSLHKAHSSTAGIDRCISVYCGIKVNQTEKLHVAAIGLLQRLGLDNVRLEAEGKDRFTY